MRRRKRSRIINPYGLGKCRVCGDDAVPPLAAELCQKHLPKETKCGKCGATYPWRYDGPGICPVCFYHFMLSLEKEHPNFIGWQYLDFEALRRAAKKFKQSQAA